MKPTKSLLSIKKTRTTRDQTSYFVTKKNQNLNTRYKKVLEERKKIIRAKYAADRPLDDVLKAKEQMINRRINRMKYKFINKSDKK